MPTLRRLPALLALGFVGPVVAACSGAPDDPAAATATSALVGPAAPSGTDGGDDGGDNECSLGQGCSVTPDPDGWAHAAVPANRIFASAINPWITELQQAGCSTPAVFTARSRFHFWVQTCPESVSSIPVPPPWGSFSRLVIPCNACVPPAPPGYVNIGWLAPPYPPPSGCKEGGCTGLPAVFLQP